MEEEPWMSTVVRGESFARVDGKCLVEIMRSWYTSHESGYTIKGSTADLVTRLRKHALYE